MSLARVSHEVFCAYLPDFPAWTFRYAGVQRGTPLAVVGTGSDSGHIVACTRPARSAGIEPGITAARAEQLCPECVIRTRDLHLEEAVWDEIVTDFHGLTPFMEAERPFVVTAGTPVEPVRQLVRRLECQGGIGTHRTAARLAAVRAAPGNTLYIRAAHTAGFYDRFGLDRLTELGFDEEVVELLGLFGYTSLGALRSLSKRHLVHQFGEEGIRLHRLTHPPDEPPPALFVPPRCIRLSHEWDEPVCQPHELEPVLARLTQTAAETMRHETCQRVRVFVRHAGDAELRFTARILIEPTCRQEALFRIANRLLHGLLAGGCAGIAAASTTAASVTPAEMYAADTPAPAIEWVSLELGSLRHFAPRQTSLFRRRPEIDRAVQAVHRRFPGQMQRAVLCPNTLFSEDEASLEPFPEASGLRSLLPGSA